VIENNMLGNLAAINFQLRPALDNLKRDPNWRKWRKEELFNLLTREQLQINTEKVRSLSPILRGMAERGEINIVSGIYDVETGKVVFLNGE
jgi:carbonic anhydrase